MTQQIFIWWDVQTQLESGHYESPEDFAADVRLVWSNAMTYNSEDTEIHSIAKVIIIKRGLFVNLFNNMLTSVVVCVFLAI